MAWTWDIDAAAVGRLVRRVRDFLLPCRSSPSSRPMCTDIVPIAAAAAEACADAVSLINTIQRDGRGLAAATADPLNDIGGLSWPGDQAGRAPERLAGGSGTPWNSANHRYRRHRQGLAMVLKFMVAGASAIQVGTATFYNPPVAENSPR